MGFDISGFKNAFLQNLSDAANSVTQNNRIDKGTMEVSNANQVVSTFKAQLENLSNPIGDTLSISTKENNDVTLDNLLAYVDPSISEKVKNYALTKPVETIKPNQQTPKVASDMASMVSDVDIDKLNAFLDMAYNSEVADRVSDVVSQSPEDMETGYYVRLAYDVEKPEENN